MEDDLNYFVNEGNLNILQMEVNLKFVNSRQLILLIEYLLNCRHLSLFMITSISISSEDNHNLLPKRRGAKFCKVNLASS
jgi:hypothetical protein